MRVLKKYLNFKYIKNIVYYLFLIIILTLLILPLMVISINILILSGRPVLIWSNRVGQFNINFFMPKFRTMKKNTPNVATHLLKNPKQYLIPTGSFLRKYSLDELPQIYCLFSGSMSLIGPRPALFNQLDLIELRKKYSIDQIKPGITGYAQINGRDSLDIIDKVKLDKYYLNNRNFFIDFKIILITLYKVILKINIKH